MKKTLETLSNVKSMKNLKKSNRKKYLDNTLILHQWFPTFLITNTPKMFKFVLAPLASKFNDFVKNNLN